MRVWVDDEGWVVLDDASLLAEGGEGRVFAKGKRAYKVASSPQAVLDPRKLAALAAITSAQVIRPLASIRSAPGGAPLGHAMARVERAVPWMQLVPRAARARLGLDRDAALQLCARLQELVRGLHALDIAVVDLSGGNVLVDTRKKLPYLVDVDSAQAPGFPATAITPQIRDPLAKGGFGSASDWFAFAVLSFELLVGVHPFRGTHPRVQGLEARMAAGISVLDPAVRMPPVHDDPRSLPAAVTQWFADTFAGKLRAPAPWTTAVKPCATHGPRRSAARPLARADGGSIRGVLVRDTVWWWTDAHIGCNDAIVCATPSDAVGLVTAPGDLGVGMLCHGEDGTLALAIGGATRALGVTVSAVRVDGGSVIIRCGDRLGLLDMRVRPPTPASPVALPWASVRALARVSAPSCALWPGCATTRQLGSLRVVAIEGGAATVRDLPELAGAHIVDAAAAEGVVSVLAERTNRHERWIFGMRPPWTRIVHVERDVDPSPGCAVVRAADGAVWVRTTAGFAPLLPDGAIGPAVAVGDGEVQSGPTGLIRVAGDAVWPVPLPGSTAAGQQRGATAC